MNLLDMLSAEKREELYERNDILSILDENTPMVGNSLNNQEIIQPLNGTYYLPTVLTQLQRDFAEVVFQIFSSELLDEIQSKRQRTSINNLLDTGGNDFDAISGLENNSMSTYDKADLLFEQLKLINKHPSLLVDHLMPKKLLLLEVNERLVTLSGKFQLFNRILDSFIDNDSSHKRNGQYDDIDFHILILAQSIKEVELIEGLIIGKKLDYDNLSSTKLYDDNRGTSRSSQEGDNADNEPRRKRKHHESTKDNNKTPKSTSLCLTLATSQQLYNNYAPSSKNQNSQFNLIFSFDLDLDTKSPSIELIRSNNLPNKQNTLLGFDSTQLKTPILIPIPAFSLDHIILQIPEHKIINRFGFTNGKDSPTYRWKLEVLNTLAVNRHNAYEDEDRDFFLNIYGSNMSVLHEWFYKWDIMKYPFEGDDALKLFTDQLKLQFNDDKLSRELETNYLFDFGSSVEDLRKEERGVKKIKLEIDREHYKLDVFNYKTYKAKFSELIHDRVNQIEESIVSRYTKSLPSLRLCENVRQTTIDQDEDSISDNYRKLRKLNDEANIIEKKMARAESDADKYREQQQELEARSNVLQTNLIDDVKKEEDLNITIANQEKVISELTKELTTTDSEYVKLCEENNATSMKYQNNSAVAVQLSSKLAILKDTNIKLKSKLDGAGVKVLPSLTKKDELINYDIDLNRLKEENLFILGFFDEKLDKLVKERTTILETTSNGSTSRPTNRISRASTPF